MAYGLLCIATEFKFQNIVSNSASEFQGNLNTILRVSPAQIEHSEII